MVCFFKSTYKNIMNILNSQSLIESANLIQQILVWIATVCKPSVNTSMNKIEFHLKEFMIF